MKRTICTAILLAFIAFPAMAANTWHKTVGAAQKAAAEKNQFIFVDLWADWCGWCHRFEAEVVPSEAFQKATEKMTLLRLNTEDGGEGTQFAQKYQATRLPMFLLLNSDLTVAGVINGYAPAQQFASMINQGIIRYRTFQESLKTETEIVKDYPRRLQLAKELRERKMYPRAESWFKKMTTEKGVPAAFRDQAYAELAYTYLEQNKFNEALAAVAAFQKVQKEGEYFERASLVVPDVYLRQGNFGKAVDEFRTFKARFPQSPFIPNIDQLLPNLERQLKTK